MAVKAKAEEQTEAVEPMEFPAEETVTFTNRPARAERAGRDIPTVKFRGDKQLYTYRDVLNEAHEHGFTGFIQLHAPIVTHDTKGIITSAVCSVMATFADGSQWHGVGDCDQDNAGNVAGAAKVRMADTRAKARALGDALNLDANFSEEMGPDAEDRPANVSNFRPSTSKPVSQSGDLPDPGEGPYHCAICNEQIKDSGDGSGGKGNASARWKAAMSIKQTGEVRCFAHRAGA
jgi:hypothetical protein